MQLKPVDSYKMELEIIKEKDNPLFKRKEIQAKLEAAVTPNKEEVKKLIAESFSSQPENINVKGIHGKFGTKEFTIIANVYESAEEMKNTESKKKGVQSETPAQEQMEARQEEQKTESQEQELAHPDEEPTQVDKVEEKE